MVYPVRLTLSERRRGIGGISPTYFALVANHCIEASWPIFIDPDAFTRTQNMPMPAEVFMDLGSPPLAG